MKAMYMPTPTYLINGHPQKVDNNVCDIYATYTDQELDACEEGCNGNRKIIRTWTLLDWTTLEDRYLCTDDQGGRYRCTDTDYQRYNSKYGCMGL